MYKIGVLDIQGSVIEHIKMFDRIDEAYPIRIKYPKEIDEIDALIIPGGESTTMGKLLDEYNFISILKDRINNGMSVWGTCAGMILLAKNIVNQENKYIDVMDITVKRNAYGRQINSFISNSKIEKCSENVFPMVFIRAPYIVSVEKNVEILAEVNQKIVAARQDNMLVTSFHPELTKDQSIHRYFINMI